MPRVKNWAQFTKRTNAPKLTWLQKKLTEAGIPNRINGRTFHAPILEVPDDKLDKAWELLPNDIDNREDDDPMFT